MSFFVIFGMFLHPDAGIEEEITSAIFIKKSIN